MTLVKHYRTEFVNGVQKILGVWCGASTEPRPQNALEGSMLIERDTSTILIGDSAGGWDAWGGGDSNE